MSSSTLAITEDKTTESMPRANGAEIVVLPPLDAARTMAVAEALARSVGGNPLADDWPDAAQWVLLRGFTRVL